MKLCSSDNHYTAAPLLAKHFIVARLYFFEGRLSVGKLRVSWRFLKLIGKFFVGVHYRIYALN